jgi:hypothetical protein
MPRRTIYDTGFTLMPAFALIVCLWKLIQWLAA